MSPLRCRGACKCILVWPKAVSWFGEVWFYLWHSRSASFHEEGFKKCLCGGIITCQIWPQPQHCAPCVFNHNVLLQHYYTLTISITELFPEPFSCEVRQSKICLKKEETWLPSYFVCPILHVYRKYHYSHMQWYKQEFRYEPSAHQQVN